MSKKLRICKKSFEQVEGGYCPHCKHPLIVGASNNRYCLNDKCKVEFALLATTLNKIKAW